MHSWLLPNCELASILDLRADHLRRKNIRTLLVDVDSTIVGYRSRTLLPSVTAWIEHLRSEGIGICILSNGTPARVRAIAQVLRIPAICLALKPLPFGVWRALRMMRAERTTTACLGDQLFADVLAGKLAGVITFLVRPLTPQEDPWFTAIKRPLERWVLRLLRQLPPRERNCSHAPTSELHWYSDEDLQ